MRQGKHLDVIDTDVEKLFRETLSKLKDAGAEIVEIDLGHDFTTIAERATWGIFFPRDEAGNFGVF